MANMKNAKKKIKVIAKKKKNNNEYRTSMRTAMKNVEKAILASDKDKANEALGIAIKRIDKATSKGVVTKNFCARNKSRLTKKVNGM
ncbi:MAG: 30S ribosomal protein S20 [Bacilli bacterium]|nr:30S ribosomal protein S20 [Bacilli bacterium]